MVRPFLAASPTFGSSPSEGADPSDRDAVDPELLALPDPPKGSRQRAVFLLVIAAAASLAMTFALRHDVSYALSSPSAPYDITLANGIPPGVAGNRMANASGALGVAGGVRYERPLHEGSFRLLPVVGRTDLFVEVAVAHRGEHGRFVPPSTFTGRLVPLAEAGPRFRGLAKAVRADENAWLLVNGETPASDRWSVLLALVLVSAAAYFGVTAYRLVRRLPSE